VEVIEMDARLYLKALAGGLSAGLGVLFLALADNVVTGQEWVGVAQAALVTVCAVYQIPNIGGVAFPMQPVKPLTLPVVSSTEAVASLDGDPNSR
jgi:hypothetical protein